MARQKNVYKTQEVPHLWAHKTQQSARNSCCNLFFDGDTIYSYGYHFQIARHVTNKQGHEGILFNSAGDSSMTAQHKMGVRRAIPADVDVFSYPAGRRRELTLDNCLQSMRSSYKTDINNLLQATRRPSKAKAYYGLVFSRANLRDFGDFIGVDTLSTERVLTEAEELEYIAIAREHHDKVEAARKAKADERAESWRKRREEREAQEKMTLAERIDAWRAGKYANLPYGHPVMVRINGNTVETSQGATFPLEHAVKGLPLVMAIINRNMSYQRGESDSIIRLGHYSIDSIGDGVLKAGCHVVTYDEVRHLAGLVQQQQTVAV